MSEYPDLFVLRHGETVWNLLGKFQGRKDSPLTERGQLQALKQGELLATIQKQPRKVYASPLGRTVHTARLALGSDRYLVLDNRLQEIDFGDWEGSTREEIKSQIDCPFESGLWNFRSPGGESFAMISERVGAFLKELTQPAIVVTHGTTSIVLRGQWLGLSLTETLLLPKDQGCVYHLSDGAEIVLN